jgi:hypothetical protein
MADRLALRRPPTSSYSRCGAAVTGRCLLVPRPTLVGRWALALKWGGARVSLRRAADYGFSGQACRSGLRHHHRYSNKVNRQGFVRASGLLTSAFAIALLEGNIVT